MTAAILATVLALSPGIRLADDAPRAATLQSMTEDQMMARLKELKANRPSLVGPIVMLSVGAVLAIPGAYFLVATIEVLGATMATKSAFVAIFGTIAGVVLGAFTVVFLLPAAILVTLGAIFLPLGLSEMNAQDEEREDLERRLNTMPAREIGPPPPPPPPPPQAHLTHPVLRPVLVF